MLNPWIREALISTCVLNMTILVCIVVEISLMKNFIILRMDRQNLGEICKNYTPKQAGSFSIPCYNISTTTCIPNMIILACTVVEISLSKNFIILRLKRRKVEYMEE